MTEFKQTKNWRKFRKKKERKKEIQERIGSLGGEFKKNEKKKIPHEMW